MDVKESTLEAVRILSEKLGKDIIVLDIHEVSVIGDYFVIATGKNQNHVKSLSDYVEEGLAKKQIYSKQVEGYANANWILMDYGDFIIHLFDADSRAYYDLERIWRDAKSYTGEEFLRS